MTGLEQLAGLIVDVVFETDPAEFDAIAAAVDALRPDQAGRDGST
jgi:hypothetical protein